MHIDDIRTPVDLARWIRTTINPLEDPGPEIERAYARIRGHAATVFAFAWTLDNVAKEDCERLDAAFQQRACVEVAKSLKGYVDRHPGRNFYLRRPVTVEQETVDGLDRTKITVRMDYVP